MFKRLNQTSLRGSSDKLAARNLSFLKYFKPNSSGMAASIYCGHGGYCQTCDYIPVTGGTGFIASWIIKQLLNDGYNVHATVRKPENKQNVSHLENIANQAPGVLKLFKADLLDPGSFAMAAEGCELAIHTASPFIMSGIKNPYEELIRPALEGTRNVLDSVNRSTSVRRVVLTSSVAAIYGDAVELSAISGGAFTEDHWNTTSSESHQAYSYSKLVAEKEA
jgi:nucleoside-diphosphate-sugar epimerase